MTSKEWSPSKPCISVQRLHVILHNIKDLNKYYINDTHFDGKKINNADMILYKYSANIQYRS